MHLKQPISPRICH